MRQTATATDRPLNGKIAPRREELLPQSSLQAAPARNSGPVVHGKIVSLTAITVSETCRLRRG